MLLDNLTRYCKCHFLLNPKFKSFISTIEFALERTPIPPPPFPLTFDLVWPPNVYAEPSPPPLHRQNGLVPGGEVGGGGGNLVAVRPGGSKGNKANKPDKKKRGNKELKWYLLLFLFPLSIANAFSTVFEREIRNSDLPLLTVKTMRCNYSLLIFQVFTTLQHT